MPAGRRRRRRYGKRFRPLGDDVEDASSQKRTCSHTRTRARARARTERDSMTARASFRWHHTAAAAAAAGNPKIEVGWCWCWCWCWCWRCLFVAQAAPSRRLLCWCLQSWDGSGVTAVKPAAEALLGCRCYSHAVFSFFVLFCLPRCLTSRLPFNFRRGSCRIWSTSHANAPKSGREGNTLLLAELKFFFHFCRKHAISS